MSEERTLNSPLCGSKRELRTRFFNEAHHGVGAPQARPPERSGATGPRERRRGGSAGAKPWAKPPGSSLTRREFAGVVAAGAALPRLVTAQNPPQTRQPDGTPPPQRRLVPETPPFGTSLELSLKPIAARVAPFPMTQVRLLPNSIDHDAQELNRGYMA